MQDFRQPRTHALFIGAVAGIVVLMIVSTAYTLWRLRSEEIDKHLTLVSLQSRSFESTLTQSFNNIDLTLRNVLDADLLRRPTRQIGESLALSLRAMPQLRSLSLIDAAGRIVASSNGANAGRLVDTKDFLPPTTASAEILRVGRPWTGRDFDTGTPTTLDDPATPDALTFMPVLRGVLINGSPHTLLGAVNPDYFINQLGRELGDGAGSAKVWRYDGTLILSTDLADRPGARIDDSIHPAPGAEFGSAELRGKDAGTLAAWRTARNFPLMVMVQIDRDAALAKWRGEAALMAGLVGMSILLILAISAYYYRRMIRAVERQSAADERLRLAARVFDASTEGIIITDPHARILSVNSAFTEITGYSVEEAQGQNPKLIASGQHDASFYERMWQKINEHGHWEGEIFNRRKNGVIYPEWLAVSRVLDKEGQISHYVGVFSDITDRKANELRIRYLSEHDFLTGLPNRLLFQDRVTQSIAHAERQNQRLAILFLDLDRFKQVNDSLGHHCGDRLLKEVSARLAACVRATDTVCRQGGDEFLMLIEALDHPQDAARVAEKVIERIGQPHFVDGHEIFITPSIGIALYPDDGRDMATLIKSADLAMYYSKEKGRNTYHFYTSSMNDSASERLTLEHGLKRSLTRGELELHYQPLVAVNTGVVVGVEALLRWTHPQLGPISPMKFIPLAEESNLIVQLGEWVVRSACQQAVEWAKSGLPPFTVAVNVSALQFSNPGFLDSIRRILDETGMRGDHLEFEVTESVLMDQIEHRANELEQLRNLGIRLSVDDFGTGYSSLSYLHKLPIDKLKIDRSFVRDVTLDPDDATITATIIRMAHSIGLKVVAEGVETNEQMGFLRARGCDEAQGFLFGTPMPPRDFAAHLRRRESRLRRVA